VSHRFRRTSAVDIEQPFESNRRSTAAEPGGEVMGCAQQAVLEFDEEVRAPWRPRLVPDVPDSGAVAPSAPRQGRVSRPSTSRVGVCRPPGEARHAASGRPPAARLRLTRRARRLATVLALAAGVALGSWVGPLVSGGGASDLRLAGGTSVVVEPGDTLWSIASSLDGDSDVRTLIDEIQELNGLDGAELVPGQKLQLP
jgi:nucleoid-associated protein YgaU